MGPAYVENCLATHITGTMVRMQTLYVQSVLHSGREDMIEYLETKKAHAF